MMQIFKTTDGRISTIEEKEEGCWISLIAPSETELIEVAKQNRIELDDIRAALDDEERSRIQIEDNYTMIIVDVPTIEMRNEKPYYVTIPMSIILANKTIITVCLEKTEVLKAFSEARIRNFHTHMKTRFVLQILYKNASMFLQYLRNINRQSETIETNMHKSTKNKELIEMLELEKSLMYFTTSLRSNEMVLEKLLKSEGIKKYPEDEDLLEDVIIENKQAIEMSNIYTGILSGMTDAFASIINNNLNIIMKILATITIVLSIPTMIFSAYGMNLNPSGMPLSQSPFGFALVIIFAVVLSLFVAFIFFKNNLF
ncbi:MAG: magnesium transporter CorA family protein [Oscillospiraceae bacterium]|nr:magnesium transporter CorA family protein [Oscillospiraceae bacterium]